MIEGAAGQYGILDYENWVIMHTCMAAGFTPFPKAYRRRKWRLTKTLIFKLFQNAKKVSDDQAALARDMITGEIIGTFPGSASTRSRPRASKARRRSCACSRTRARRRPSPDAQPNGKSGIVWIEVTSLVANPSPTPLAEAFLIYCHTPEAAYKVATQAPGTLNPVVQMGAPEVSWISSPRTSLKRSNGAMAATG